MKIKHGFFALVLVFAAVIFLPMSTQAATVGDFSQTCDNYVAAGWATKNACLHDGRWHLVYDASKNTGSKASLINLAIEGADVRVATLSDQLGTAGAGYATCANVVLANGYLYCLDSMRMAGDVTNPYNPYNGFGSSVASTNGNVMCLKLSYGDADITPNCITLKGKWMIRF